MDMQGPTHLHEFASIQGEAIGRDSLQITDEIEGAASVRQSAVGTHPGTSSTSTGAANPADQSTRGCICMFIVQGIIFVGFGLIIAFQVSPVFGIGPIVFGTIFVVVALSVYRNHRKRLANRTVEVGATIAPQYAPAVSNEGWEANAHPDDVPSYTSTMQGNQGMQYGGFPYSTSVSSKPPPSYAEATRKM